jgi:hypothetical protein
VPRHLGADRARLIVTFNAEVALEQLDHGEKARVFAVGDRGALEHMPRAGVVRMDELVDQARLPDARLAHRCHHLAVPCCRLLQRLPESRHLALPPHEAGEPPGCRRLQAPPDGRHPD